MNAVLLLSYYDGNYALPLGSCTDYLGHLRVRNKSRKNIRNWSELTGLLFTGSFYSDDVGFARGTRSFKLL